MADYASKAQNIEHLYDLGALKQLRTLLLDPADPIKNSAALALGRIANHSEKIANAVVEEEVLPQLIVSLAKQNVTLCISRISTRKQLALC